MNDSMIKGNFPYADWKAVNHKDWLSDLFRWFDLNYSHNPNYVMSQLLDHVFSVINNSQAAVAPLERVMQLGLQIQTHLPEFSIYDLEAGRDQRIFALIARGLHRHHSHLFVAPQILKENLLTINEYSALLLSTKLHAAGDYDAASKLVQSIARGCPLAQYIIGQGYRKRGGYQLADMHFDLGLDDVSRWEAHKCPFNVEFAIICSEWLLTAEILRGKAVIYRKAKDLEKAEDFYLRAEQAIDQAIELSLHVEPRLNTTYAIWANHERLTPLHVKADVLFSHGYYWYEQNSLDKAALLFQDAIGALEKSNEQWDSPYTRLAVIHLCKGNYRAAADVFTKAYMICANTSVERNREAPLSLALCTLGLKVVEICDPSLGRLTFNDLLKSVENALDAEPRLSIGPLECHRDDAQKLLQTRGLDAQGKKLIGSFVQRLDREISKYHARNVQVRSMKQVAEKIKILFLAANPLDTPRLRLDEEIRAIDQSLQQTEFRDRFEIQQQWAVRVADLQSHLLRYKPHIVHFSGHGSKSSEIILEDRFGESRAVSAEAIGRLFAILKENIKCVVLNACYSEFQARAIAENIGCVIGMSRSVNDVNAISFAASFYQAIGYGKDIKMAFDLGCLQIDLESLDGSDIPKLLALQTDPQSVKFTF